MRTLETTWHSLMAFAVVVICSLNVSADVSANTADAPQRRGVGRDGRVARGGGPSCRPIDDVGCWPIIMGAVWACRPSCARIFPA